MNRAQEIERSISKKFRGKLWGRFIKAIRDYELIQEGDRIAVCISGGKDSMCMAKLMQMLQRHSDIPFETVYLMMDPGYKEENRELIEHNAREMGIPLQIFDTRLFEYIDSLEGSPCYMCAKIRRGALYAKAREFGCNKIALGHHFEDVIETTLMSMFYASKLEAMIPKLHAKNFEGMELIRPMYCIHEDDIIHWASYNGLRFIQCACSFTARRENDSKRAEMKVLVKEMKKGNPDVDKSIFNSIHKVYIDTFPGYKKDEKLHSFLETYDDEEKE